MTGIGTDTLKLKGLVMPLLSRAGGKAVGVQRIENLRTLAEAGEPFMLSTSEKADLGTWCLTQIDETQTELLAGGMPRMQEFTLEFTRYGDDLQIV
ncbi:MAG: hypothetical protein GAK44_00162 [Pseudomonas delhiensis]|nr:MAG: hypothetical protein GAK44_00162 [Pseudomonas delhiensis]